MNTKQKIRQLSLFCIIFCSSFSIVVSQSEQPSISEQYSQQSPEPLLRQVSASNEDDVQAGTADSLGPAPPQLESADKYIYDTVMIETYVRISGYMWTGNPMANGEWPYVGCVACSDYDYSLRTGSQVCIDSVWYEIKDRTASRIQDDFPLMTFDIYVGAKNKQNLQKCRQLTTQRKKVTIMKVSRTLKNPPKKKKRNRAMVHTRLFFVVILPSKLALFF